MKDSLKSMRSPMNIVLGAVCGIVIGYGLHSASETENVLRASHIEANKLNDFVGSGPVDTAFYPYWEEADFKATRGSVRWKEIAHYGIGLPE